MPIRSNTHPPTGDESHVKFTQQSKNELYLGFEDALDRGKDDPVQFSYPNAQSPRFTIHRNDSPLAYFLLCLIARLQEMATVPCLDVMAYAKWIEKSRHMTALSKHTGESRDGRPIRQARRPKGLHFLLVG